MTLSEKVVKKKLRSNLVQCMEPSFIEGSRDAVRFSGRGGSCPDE